VDTTGTQPAKEPVKVEIKVDSNGKFTYGGAGETVHAPQRGKIEWSCNVPFTIHFDTSRKSPCTQRTFVSKNGKVMGEVRGDADGRYKYIVAAGKEDRIFVDDPQVIVP
jgi:hypothetical protein